ncbi:hypothetical protein GRI39_10825 [Altererythrobacter indicus]|uniref:Uncharacterized protein n=1 Tax=Altericroceibacterium indicum TaxID=374177 RepID=A0A845ABA9_9SPHN|nr:hypothetical protein [Altericroceibacterium indicum]MXP26533.1 hypothetical protein [Altericroceibacterium indicum]
MANSKSSQTSTRIRRDGTAPRPRIPWVQIALVVILAVGGLLFVYWAPVREAAQAGTSYSAHLTCSCRFLAGREAGDCASQLADGSDFVFTSTDEHDRSVTAYVPLVASQTATYREGYGCVLESWKN